MINTSGLHPLGRAVLVKPFEVKAKEGGLIHIPKGVSDRQQMIEQRVAVVEIGPSAWPDEPPRAAPGDVVLIAKMTGFFANEDLTADGQTYILVNDRDIFCGIEVKETDHE